MPGLVTVESQESFAFDSANSVKSLLTHSGREGWDELRKQLYFQSSLSLVVDSQEVERYVGTIA